MGRIILWVCWLLVPLILSGAGQAAAAELPSYNTAAYCEKIGAVVGGSYQIEAACRDIESEAARLIRSKSIPTRVWRYCDDIGRTVDGSYQIFNACVDMELEAARSMQPE